MSILPGHENFNLAIYEQINLLLLSESIAFLGSHRSFAYISDAEARTVLQVIEEGLLDVYKYMYMRQSSAP
jgi:hypothetical protein